MLSQSPFFLGYSVVLFLCPFGCLILLLCQFFGHRSDDYAARKAKFLTYAIYSSGVFCGIIGYSLHMSKFATLWCERFGLPICFAFYGGSKALAYLFFLDRAKMAHGMLSNAKRIFFNYVGPIFIGLYWLVYCGVTGLFFVGRHYNAGDSLQDGALHGNKLVSFCIVGESKLWFVILASVVDLTNSIVSVSLFVRPLMLSTASLHEEINPQNAVFKVELHRALKWNVCCTAIASLSSSIGVLLIPFTGDFVWFICLLDPFINCLCIFCMLRRNRDNFMKCCTRLLICTCRCCGCASGSGSAAQIADGMNDHHVNQVVAIIHVEAERKTAPPNTECTTVAVQTGYSNEKDIKTCVSV